MSGQLALQTGVYGNAAEFACAIPTCVHHLWRAGYQTCLSGKMHFVVSDQLHGSEERLTIDIYSADFGWTPDYCKLGERIDWRYQNMGSVTGAGCAEISNQLNYDDEVAYQSVRKLYDLACGGDQKLLFLTISFSHPHDSYVAPKNTRTCMSIAIISCRLFLLILMRRKMLIRNAPSMQMTFFHMR